jgi:hypothetical protein
MVSDTENPNFLIVSSASLKEIVGTQKNASRLLQHGISDPHTPDSHQGAARRLS